MSVKLYWPTAIALRRNASGTDDFYKVLTYEPVTSLSKAQSCIRAWECVHGKAIIKSWIDTFDGKRTSTDVHVHFGRVKDLWQCLGDVSFDPVSECITQPWGSFKKGTHREEIWHWFEETFNVSVGRDLIGHEEEVWDREHTHVFRIVNDPCYPAYKIWNIGKHMPDGYLPMSRMKQVQPFDGVEEIDTDTLHAIRTDGAQDILNALGFGPETSAEMTAYVEGIEDGRIDRRFAYAAELMQKAIPWLKKLGL